MFDQKLKVPIDLLVNLAFVPRQPTGLAVYALNVVKHLSIDKTGLLSAQGEHQALGLSSPAKATSEFGRGGHLRRLLWTQFKLPQIYKKAGAKLLFSPVPELPLGARVPSVVTVHDLIPLRFPVAGSFLTPYFRYYLPWVLNQAQHIITNSAATARDLVDLLHVPAAKITPIPLAYDAEQFRPLNLPRQPYFLYVGRHNPHKNLSRLLQGFAQLKHPETELWLAGTPDPRFTPALQQEAQALGVSHRLRFLSYVSADELPRLMNQARALVFPSLWEGFGLPVLEAMACGTPVITSNCSSLPEVAGDSAILVDPECVDALAAAMTAVSEEAGVWQSLHEAGLARAQQFSWKQTGQQTGEVLKAVMAT